MIDFLAIGDTTLDTFLMLNHDEVKILCDLNKEDCQLCLNYADKIPVEEIHDSIAGNAGNAAVSASRLGLSSFIWTIMGDDDTGHRALEKFKHEDVDTTYFEYAKGSRSNASTVINIDGERTILIYHSPKVYRLPQNLKPAKWLYLTSMSQGSEVIFTQLIEYIGRTGAKLVFQPGTFQLRLGSSRARSILQASEIFFANKEETQGYTGLSQPDIRELIGAVHKLGPRIVVVTDGPEGAWASDGKAVWHLGILQEVPRIEATGAGDSFATGFTCARALGHDIPTALRWGQFNSAGVIQKIGPQAGLLTRDQMHDWQGRYPRLKAKKLS